MAERFVSVGHFVCVFAFLYGGTAGLHSIHQFASKALFHCVFIAAAACVDQPADRQRLTTLRSDFYGDLIRGTADTARAHFDRRLYVFKCFVKNLYGCALDFGFNPIKRTINDTFSCRFLTIDHQVVHELGQYRITIFGVGQDFAFFGGVTT